LKATLPVKFGLGIKDFTGERSMFEFNVEGGCDDRGDEVFESYRFFEIFNHLEAKTAVFLYVFSNLFFVAGAKTLA
jgi:hypothetical protein